MSFPQTTSAEGVPVAASNGLPAYHVSQALSAPAVTAATFTLVGTVGNLALPTGKYAISGSLAVTTTIPVGSFICMQIQVNNIIVTTIGFVVSPSAGGALNLPIYGVINLNPPVYAVSNIGVFIACDVPVIHPTVATAVDVLITPVA